MMCGRGSRNENHQFFKAGQGVSISSNHGGGTFCFSLFLLLTQDQAVNLYKRHLGNAGVAAALVEAAEKRGNLVDR